MRLREQGARKERRMWSEWVFAIVQRGTQPKASCGASGVNNSNERRTLKDALGQWHPWMDYWSPYEVAAGCGPWRVR